MSIIDDAANKGAIPNNAVEWVDPMERRQMSDKELRNTVEAMTSFRVELTSSPERALTYLVEAGILLPDGNDVDQRPMQDA